MPLATPLAPCPAESTALTPAQHLSGRIGQPAPGDASPVPRVGSAADASLLGRPLGSVSGSGLSAPLAGGPPSGGGGSVGGPAGAPSTEDHTKYAFYNIKRYRGLFNVDTADVLALCGC